jgi:hypothetical protein
VVGPHELRDSLDRRLWLGEVQDLGISGDRQAAMRVSLDGQCDQQPIYLALDPKDADAGLSASFRHCVLLTAGGGP